MARRASDLRLVPYNFFRCPPGRHPRVGLLRCSGCDRMLAVRVDGGRLVLMPDQTATVRAIRERDREVLADELSAAYERDR